MITILLKGIQTLLKVEKNSTESNTNFITERNTNSTESDISYTERNTNSSDRITNFAESGTKSTERDKTLLIVMS